MIVEFVRRPRLRAFFYALMLGWGLNAEGAEVTQRRREEGGVVGGLPRWICDMRVMGAVD